MGHCGGGGVSNTLYDITADMARLLDLHATGEIDDQTFADTLDAGLAENAEAKLESYAYVIRNLEAEEAALKAETDRLNAKRKAAENAATRMKERVCNYLASTGQEKAKAGLFSWGLRRTKAVEIEGDVPMGFERVKIEPDKVAIKAALEAGQDVPGASLVERTTAVLK